jgi:hypothetical protein
MHKFRFLNGVMQAPLFFCGIEGGGAAGAGGAAAPIPDGTPLQPSNNAGATEIPASFWDDPEVTPPAGTTPAAPAPAPAPSTTESAEPFGDVRALVDAFKPASFMTPEVIAKMGENDFTGFNAGLEAHAKATLNQSAALTASILKTVVPQLMAKMREDIESKFTQTDNDKFIADNIPQYKDPKLARQVTQVFEQSMKHTKGDKAKAIDMTKSMLAAMGSAFAPADSKTVSDPPSGRQPTVDWGKELGIHLEL